MTVPEPTPAPQEEPEAAEEPSEPAKEAFPIEGYDGLNAAKARKAVRALTSASELEVVLAHEAANKNRKTVIAEIQSEIDEKN